MELSLMITDLWSENSSACSFQKSEWDSSLWYIFIRFSKTFSTYTS